MLNMVNTKKPIAIITGGNKGLGFEACRQLGTDGYHVILTALDIKRGELAAAELRRQGCEVTFRQLDVSDQRSIEQFAAWVTNHHKPVDVLLNNAAIALDGFDASVVRQTLAVNFYGARDVTDCIAPCLAKGARVVMVSSGLGQLSCLGPQLRAVFSAPDLTRPGLAAAMQAFVADVEANRHQQAGWPNSAYNVSKVGLNALTRILARELENRSIMVIAVCPGWVRTDMGGHHAA